MSRPVNTYTHLAVIALMACSGCRLWNADARPFGSPLSAEMLDAMRQQLSRDSWRPNPEWSLLDWNFVDVADDRPKIASRWVFGSRVLDNVISQLDTAQPNPAADTDDVAEDASTTARLAQDGQSAESTGSTTTDPADKPDREPENTAAIGPVHWDGFWPLNVEQVLDSLDVGPLPMSRQAVTAGLGKHYLRQLARENSISGWNAAILLAQRDPLAAREFLSVLERIVVSYPKHQKQSETGSPEPEPAAREAVANAESDTAAASKTDESIDALIARVARQLQTESEFENARAAESNNVLKPTKPSRQAQLIDSLLERVKGASPRNAVDEANNDLEALSDSMRAAAAEAWCLVLASGADDSQQQLAAAGRVLERSDLPNGVRGELYRGVARSIAPSLIPRLSNALRVSERGRRVPLPVRRAAVESCLIHALSQRRRAAKTSGTARQQPAAASPYDSSSWPETILNCRSDTDATVRRTFGRWAAVVAYRDGVTDASAILAAQLDDRRVRVRQDALESLGWLGTPAARKTLREQAQRPEVVVRAAAVSGLSRWGVDELAAFVTDQSSHVRQAVAKKLVQYPSARSYFLMQDLLRDGDLQVQDAAVTAVANWPDDPALTLLLVALRDSSGPTRRIAFEQLRRRRTIHDAFSAFDSPQPEERRRAVNELGTRLDVPLQFSERFDVRTLGSRHKQDTLFVRDVESLLQLVTVSAHSPASPRRAEAVSRLMQLQADDVPIIEEFLLKRPDANTGFVYGKLLSRLSPAHAALNEFARSDLKRKRRAAQQLRETAAAQSLSRLAVRRLLLHLDNGQDLLIWRDAMMAVMPDAGDDHAQVALKALNDERADVRLLGCEYIRRHPRPPFANWLQQLRLLGDRDQRVRLAAIEAVGRCGNPNVLEDRAGNGTSSPADSSEATRIPGLRSLLTHSDAETRMATVIAMSHLGDRQGMQELARLSWSPEPRIRLRAVRAMGQTESTWFVEPLLRRGWTERHVDVRRAILVSLDELTLPGKRPADLVDENGYDAKIKRWLEWQETDRQTRVDRRVDG